MFRFKEVFCWVPEWAWWVPECALVSEWVMREGGERMTQKKVDSEKEWEEEDEGDEEEGKERKKENERKGEWRG